METTEGTLLGRRVRYAQPRDGYRTGIEPVLLAASVPARAGDRVIEAGVGAGAGLMCLAARVPGVKGIGIEIDPSMADLARANFALNGFGGLSIITGDVTEIAPPLADHVMANPPWHDRRSTASPVERRRVAKQESGRGIEAWISALGRAVREGGSLTMIVPPALEGRWAAACAAAGLGAMIRHVLLPKPGRAAKLVLLQAVRVVDEPSLPGLTRQSRPLSAELPLTWTPGSSPGVTGVTVLHEENGAFTPTIEAVLRHGAALALTGERRAVCLGRRA